LRYQFIERHKEAYAVRRLCAVMEVRRDGYYTYVKRTAAKTVDPEEFALLARVKAIHQRSRQSYGSRRMARQLQAEGFAVGRYRARTLMGKAQVTVRRKRRFQRTTDSAHGYPVAPNRLARQFQVQAPDRVWVADITYVWTLEGWLYLAVVLDLFSRKVVGWAMNRRLQANLAIEALRMALGRRKPKTGLIHHSDQGSQYAGEDYQRLLAEHGLVGSMSRKGDCWDNAVVERFFGNLKSERTDPGLYSTREEAKTDVIDYIEMFYNSHRLHSYLGYVSPNDLERLAKVA
jgi:putative transposase